ncbi:hypothetical protein CLV37_11917 [Kineococcus rhizosphaerae]|uniref:Uncharacterized protein n=1 Tax=Kineococcus rhizosphaerae TaxID=559628 RepID=A0A2T0QWQ8_9ACTN|nr:hypothetical protein CLV37_11917 [Kineococcus rhizosphaerae]
MADYTPSVLDRHGVSAAPPALTSQGRSPLRFVDALAPATNVPTGGGPERAAFFLELFNVRSQHAAGGRHEQLCDARTRRQRCVEPRQHLAGHAAHSHRQVDLVGRCRPGVVDDGRDRRALRNLAGVGARLCLTRHPSGAGHDDRSHPGVASPGGHRGPCRAPGSRLAPEGLRAASCLLSPAGEGGPRTSRLTPRLTPLLTPPTPSANSRRRSPAPWTSGVTTSPSRCNVELQRDGGQPHPYDRLLLGAGPHRARSAQFASPTPATIRPQLHPKTQHPQEGA